MSKSQQPPIQDDDEFLEIVHYKAKPASRSPKKVEAQGPVLPPPRRAEPEALSQQPPPPSTQPEAIPGEESQLTRPMRAVKRESRYDSTDFMQPIASSGIPNPLPPPLSPAEQPKPVLPSKKKKRARGRRQSNVVLALIGISALGLTLLIGALGAIAFRLSNEASQIAQNPTDERTPQIVTGTPLAETLDGTPTLTIPTLPPVTPTLGVQIEPWNGEERFTVLLLGLDKRPNETGTAFRTDSMIIVSIDPKTKSIGMLSVPRDLYVEIPRDTVVGTYYGLQRVNTGYYIGERHKTGYGPKLAMQTVQYNLGMRIHDYVVYDFEAVINVIDAIGGIDIDVPRNIVDRGYPAMTGSGYDPLYIKAGRQHMDGTLALKFARTRHDSSDLDRAARQQQVIMAIRDKILNLNMLPELIVRAPGIWAQLNAHVKSGLGLDQLLRLGVYAADIPMENIRTGVIDYGFVQPVRWQGMDVLVPNRYSIGPLLVKVFGPNYNN